MTLLIVILASFRKRLVTIFSDRKPSPAPDFSKALKYDSTAELNTPPSEFMLSDAFV